MQIQILKIHFQYICAHVRTTDDHSWFLTTTYASPKEDKKKCLWKDLEVFCQFINNGWLVAGDFNDILYLNEKRGVLLQIVEDVEFFKREVTSARLVLQASSILGMVWWS